MKKIFGIICVIVLLTSGTAFAKEDAKEGAGEAVTAEETTSLEAEWEAVAEEIAKEDDLGIVTEEAAKEDTGAAVSEKTAKEDDLGSVTEEAAKEDTGAAATKETAKEDSGGMFKKLKNWKSKDTKKTAKVNTEESVAEETAKEDTGAVPKVRTKGGLRYTITVSDFENKAGYAGKYRIGNALGTIMTDILMQTGAFVVIGESGMRRAAMQEQDLAAAGRSKQGRKTPKIGQMTPAQLLVRGVITHIEDGTSGESGGIGLFGISIGGKRGKSEINLTIYLVDSQTGMVKASKSVVGTSEQKGMAIGINRGGFSAKYGKTKKDNMGKAIEAAIIQAVDFMIEQLDGISWSGSIVMAKPGKIIINRGKREGVKVGQVFLVGNVEQIIDPDSGEVLDEEVTTVGKIEVVRLKEKIAYCKAIKGKNRIRRKMAITLP